MRARVQGSLSLLAILLLAVLLVLAVRTGRRQYQSLVLITPTKVGVPGKILEKIEWLCEDEFLITYEIRRQAAVHAIHTSHSATLVATNSSYPDVMGYRLLDGGFFTKSALDAKSKHTVLNKTAAFQLFGSDRISGRTLQINGETWIVVGVMQDNDKENANLYLPASVTGGGAEALMALMDGGVTEATISNTLKALGIHETSHTTVNLSRSASMFWERFTVAWQTALCGVILLLVRRGTAWLIQRLRIYRSRLRQVYLRELIAQHRLDFVKTAAMILLLVTEIGALLLLLLQVLAICLTWQGFELMTVVPASGSFGEPVRWLQKYHAAGIAVFAASLSANAACLIAAWKLKPRQPHTK